MVEELFVRIVRRDEIETEMNQLNGKIKTKDLENLAIVRHESVEHLVAHDKDYEEAKVKKCITPKEFGRLFKLKPYKLALV